MTSDTLKVNEMRVQLEEQLILFTMFTPCPVAKVVLGSKTLQKPVQWLEYWAQVIYIRIDLELKACKYLTSCFENI